MMIGTKRSIVSQNPRTNANGQFRNSTRTKATKNEARAM
jgi:hypothetical protein